MKIVYSKRAFGNLQKISDYLIQKNPHAERRVLAVIRSAIEVLEVFPELGKPVGAWDFRCMSLKQYAYLIYYRIQKNSIIIAHIRHTSRMPADPQNDL